jgi:uncharacterized membrane protein YdjX (TVP38/TMEM64 family)
MSARPSSSAAPPTHLKLRYVLLAVLLVVGVVALFVLTELDWRSIPAALERVSKPVALLVMATLPMVGFPVSAVYLGAGAIFGPWMGLLVVIGVTATHLLFVRLLARSVLRGTLERLRNRWSHRIPDLPADAQPSLVAMVAIMPGPPYFVRNCVLALAEVPLQTLFAVALPLYVIRSCATIFLGDLGSNPSLTALGILGGIYAIKLTATVLLFRRLRRSVHAKPRASAHQEVGAVARRRPHRRRRHAQRHAGRQG